MQTALHILTRTDDALATEIVARQRREPDASVRVVDLTSPDANYDDLLEQIFAADSVVVW